MEEEKSSVIEASDWTSVVKYKGVVSQPNGHFGAQIYGNHQRVWLGTFKSEIDAAMAYDSASLKLRTGDNHRNFPWTHITVNEPKFQNLHNTEAILNMIKDGSYPSRFAEFLTNRSGKNELDVNLVKVHSQGGFTYKLLFQKGLTPSDVSKLNRLVVPKKYAVKYFPTINENSNENMNGGKGDEVHLFFCDRTMKLWKFRYCYWKSSQSFVFTRGWNRFVKEKGLMANDKIAFHICEGRERGKQRQSFWAIDICYNRDSRNATVDKKMCQNFDMQIDLRLMWGQSLSSGLAKEEKGEFEDPKVFPGLMPTPIEKKSVRLFGVEIN